MTSHFINRHGYALKPTPQFTPGFLFAGGRRIYEFTLDYFDPLTFYDADTQLFVQPDRHGFSDMGTISRLCQLVVPKDQFIDSFVMHDSACVHHGLYIARLSTGPFLFHPMHSHEVHALLGRMVHAEGGTIRAHIIGPLVLAFGPRWTVSRRAPWT